MLMHEKPCLIPILMSLVVDGDISCAAVNVSGRKPSVPVACNVSCLPMKIKTWSHVIGVIWRSYLLEVYYQANDVIFQT